MSDIHTIITINTRKQENKTIIKTKQSIELDLEMLELSKSHIKITWLIHERI